MIHRLTRNPALVVGVLTGLFGVLVAFGVNLTDDQVAAAVVFLGAVMALVQFLTTPAREVLAQVLPSGEVVAGAASSAPTGGVLVTASARNRLETNGLGEGELVVPVSVDPDAP